MKSIIALVLAAGLFLPIDAPSPLTGRVGEGFVAHASTEVGGTIDADTTWPLSSSPYLVISNILISVGVTLTIEAGVTVRFESGKALLAEGTLIARGMAEQPITFTSNATSPAAGDWGGITFASTSPSATYDGDTYTGGSILQYAIVEYGGGGSRNGAVSAEGSAPFIDHNTVRYNSSSGIYADTATTRITNNTVHSNSAYYSNGYYSYGGGIRARFSTVSGNTVYSNSASDSGGGIIANNATRISCNTVVDNSSEAQVTGGLEVYGRPQVISNTIYANSPYDLVNYNSYSTTPLDATNNYWGTTDSGEIAAHIYEFYDDNSRQRVVYSPFLSVADPCAPAAPEPPPPTATPMGHRVYMPAIARNYAGGW